MVQLSTFALLALAPIPATVAPAKQDAALDAPAIVSPIRHDAQAVTLPSGSSEAFRQWVLDGDKAPDPPLRIRSRTDAPKAARLDQLIISSPFGRRSDPIKGVERHHAGIDLPDPWGSRVMATGPGVVRIAGWVRGYGNLIEIEHVDGVRTRYGHLSRLNVFPSEHVEQGQVIGQVGSTGRSTGPHLHYEVRVSGVAVDPLRFIGRTAPSYETVWGTELRATPKWVGFAERPGKSLPQSSIR